MVANTPLDQRRIRLEDILAQMLTLETSLRSLALELSQELANPDDPDCIRDLHQVRLDQRRLIAAMIEAEQEEIACSR